MKFEDSPTMRALEKVAKEKGLVKPESLQKKAAVTKKADYTPTPNLMENIFKLCAGLRDNGLKKEADEIEMNYLNLKRAQTLYETSKEKGEDLIHDAHPKGSHKLEGVEGDAVVEDILDQHLKIVEMVSKKPTGKLSNAAVMNAVKKALGQMVAPQESEVEINQKIDEILTALPRRFGAIVSNVNRYGDSDWATISKEDSATKAAAVTNILGKRPFTRTEYNMLTKAYSDFITWAQDTGAFEDSIWHSSDHNAQSKQRWASYVAPSIAPVKAAIEQLNDWLVKRDTIQTLKEQGEYKVEEENKQPITLPTVEVESDPLAVKLNTLVNRLKSYFGVLSISRDPAAKKWITDEIKEIEGMRDRIYEVSENQPAERKRMDARYQQDAAVFEQEVNQFETDWVNAKR